MHPRALEIFKQNLWIVLIDATYKTNKFNLLLVNICGITGNNQVIQLGLVFLLGEKQGDYQWAIT